MEQMKSQTGVMGIFPNDVLSCLLTFDVDSGRWNGHCLDFDIVTSGLNQDAAWSNLKDVVRLHVEQCFTNWRVGLNRSASQDHWDFFRMLSSVNRPFRQDRIEFDLIEPAGDDIREVWLKALTAQEGSLNGQTKSAVLQ